MFEWKDILSALIKTFWDFISAPFHKDFWVSDFPNAYHPKCFECNLGKESCPACEFRAWGRNPGHVYEDGQWVKCEY